MGLEGHTKDGHERPLSQQWCQRQAEQAAQGSISTGVTWPLSRSEFEAEKSMRRMGGDSDYAAPPAVGSGENEVCQSRSRSVGEEVDMEVEDIRGEFEVANAVNSSAEVSQFPNFSQYVNTELRTDAEVSEAVRQLPNLLSVQSPVVCDNFAESTVLEASENSRGPSSRSTVTMSVESGSEKSAKRFAAEACCEFENVVNSVRSQNIEQLTAFNPAKFEGVRVSGEVIDAVISEAVLPKRQGVYRFTAD